jgi:hypothetical protein
LEITLPDGRKVPATEVSIKKAIENWNEYELDDGNTIRIKLVVVRVLKTLEKDPVTGEPVYITNTQNLMAMAPTKEDKK